jgi:hypothetical protein
MNDIPPFPSPLSTTNKPSRQNSLVASTNSSSISLAHYGNQDMLKKDTYDTFLTGNNERTIPFLRRLTDMLLENNSVISFVPGERMNNGHVVFGRIIVHDRIKVETEVLPKYFNHSSFASLRRQLNYFSFSRIGKGKQKGAVYCNDQVVDLEDILRLKRKTVGDTTTTATVIPSAVSTMTMNGDNMSQFMNNSNDQFQSLSSNKTIDPQEKDQQLQSKGKEGEYYHVVEKKLNNLNVQNMKTSFAPKNVMETIDKKFRPVQSTEKSSMPPTKRRKSENSASINKEILKIIHSVVPVIHIPPRVFRQIKKSGHDPCSMKTSDFESVPLSGNGSICSSQKESHLNKNNCPLGKTNFGKGYYGDSTMMDYTNQDSVRESDVIDGCSALLSLGCKSH